MAKKKKVVLPKCYIDSCVFLSYVEVTPGRIDLIDGLFAECEERWTAYTSHLSIAEVAFAQWEKTNAKLEPEVEAKIDALWMPGSPFELAEVSEFITRDAKSLNVIGHDNRPLSVGELSDCLDNRCDAE